MNAWTAELPKLISTCLSGGFILALGWLVGQRVTTGWNIRQKRQEMQLLALQQFYVAYGEFFVVWKLWNRVSETDSAYLDKQWELHKRSAAAEAIAEGLYVRLSAEGHLAVADVQLLGRFRQAFQQLRERIKDGQKLEWYGSELPEYQAFKTLAVRVAILLSSGKGGDGSERKAIEDLLAITSNLFESTWSVP